MKSAESLKTKIITITVIILFSGLCAFYAYYTSVQAELLLAKLCDEALGPSSRQSSWKVIRDGPVLASNFADAKDLSAYLIVIKQSGGEYRAIVEMDKYGKIKKSKTIFLNGTILLKRLATLIDKQAQDKQLTDSSVLDPIVISTFNKTINTLVRLEQTKEK